MLDVIILGRLPAWQVLVPTLLVLSLVVLVVRDMVWRAILAREDREFEQLANEQ